MRLIITLCFILSSIQFHTHSQFNVGVFSNYNLASKLSVGAFTEYSIEDYWSAVLKVNYAYTIPYSKPGSDDPVVKQTGTNFESSIPFAKTRETFKHHFVSFEYKQYMGDYSDCYSGGAYWKSIIGFTFSKVNREWEFPKNEFLAASYDLFTIEQISLNLGVGCGYDLKVSDKFFLHGDLSAMLPFIKITNNSKDYDGFPEISLGFQLGAKYTLF